VILTAHQPTYLPWLGLFHKIYLADKFIWMDFVQYLKQDWNNRNRVKTANGPLYLTVPVKTDGYIDKPISQIQIDNSHNWRNKHLKTLQAAYGRAAYFKRYMGFFEDVYHKRWDGLVELNAFMLRYFLEELGITTEVVWDSSHKYRGKKSELVLDMCLQEEATAYVFGGQGRNYADEQAFHSHGVKTVFQSYSDPIYTQLHGEFVSSMSIVDLLFNEGPRSREILLSGNLGKDALK